MLRKKCLILAIASSVLLLHCIRNFSVAPQQKSVRELTTLEKQLTSSNNAFGLNLFKEIVRTSEQENIFISPLSVAMALGMTLNGAGGDTYEAIKTTLGFEGMTEEQINRSFMDLIELLTGLDPDVQFDIANSIWVRQGFDVLQDFIDANRHFFDALIQNLDFSSPQATDVINAWVSDNTQGKIEEIVQPPINPLTVMFLINAIYFKATWTVEFDPSKTTDDTFAKPDGSDIPVKMMRLRETLSYFETDDFQAVDLPYGEGKFSMTVILPKEARTVDELIREITSEKVSAWASSFNKKDVLLHLPKFKLEYDKKLNDILTALGMGVAFEAGRADFTRINPDVDLFISNVKHKTFVEVDEEGTEAAAATVVEITLTSAGGNPQFLMICNRPFIFLIREHHSNTILFIGKIVAPAS
ncbi:MAG: serpin family protein [bacterium]